MTFTEERPGSPSPGIAPGPAHGLAAATPAPAAPARSPFEQCDRCQSPVDRAQRYCVVCGTHQRRADDPASRFFAAARRPRTAATAVVTGSRPIGGVSSTVAALLIALLPVAAGVGIVVGRGSADSGDQVIQALKAVQGRGAGTVAVAATTPDGSVAAADSADSAKDADADAAKEKTVKVEGIDTSTKQAPILATGPSGSARKLDGTKPTAKDVEESKKAVEQINSLKGKDYIDTQRDLPDSIVIP